jgi:hypothetical protein
MMRILSFVAILSVACSASASSQRASTRPDEDAVLSVVDRFMTAISTNDVDTLSKLRLDGSFNIVERPGQDGAMVVTRRVFTPESLRSGAYRERYWDPVVHLRGGIAVVWTPYEFWQNGKTSHCGIDVFEMVKDEGTWRIANMMWTVEPEACPALRPSDPGRIRPKS